MPKTVKTKKPFINELGGEFTGEREILVAVLNPHVANWLKNRTSRLKRKSKELENENYKCSNLNCPEIAKETIPHLEAAHPIGSERPATIRKVLDQLYEDPNAKTFDIAKVLAEVKLSHEVLSIPFLCSSCHFNHKDLDPDKVVSKTLAEWGGKKRKGPKAR